MLSLIVLKLKFLKTFSKCCIIKTWQMCWNFCSTALCASRNTDCRDAVIDDHLTLGYCVSLRGHIISVINGQQW